MKYHWIMWGMLTACGGGGTGGGTALAGFDGLHDEVTGLGVTPVGDLPTQGSASYAGLIQLDLPIDGTAQTFEGAFDVTLGFDAGGTPVTGSVTDLASDAISLTGTLQIDNGAMNPGAVPSLDYQFTADIGGALDESGTIYIIDGTVAGDFYGAQWEGIAGVAFGDITQGTTVDIFDGTFVGERTP
ncbi:hypothetical protein [Yoonia sp. I 8.24]|uniref:hypothetical protein n=1 Tax=Yoonia sp. I 8.24 TaxID=1537229 RepID=UPI001EDDB260|nr:hypothetical protein [Yoonia sp. I 8.24]MCG3266477.1 hypothetical protein [Yoonia sp. I 8.24]